MAELASATTAQGPQLSLGAKARGRAPGQAIISAQDLLGPGHNRGSYAQVRWKIMVKLKIFIKGKGRSEIRVPQEVV